MHRNATKCFHYQSSQAVRTTMVSFREEVEIIPSIEAGEIESSMSDNELEIIDETDLAEDEWHETELLAEEDGPWNTFFDDSAVLDDAKNLGLDGEIMENNLRGPMNFFDSMTDARLVEQFLSCLCAIQQSWFVTNSHNVILLFTGTLKMSPKACRT